ncbi:MAG TPA: adenylate/guanylate cyclase domain-containing protein [Thermoanaerobaculia bacterium]|jgi:adenylate cyclase
MLKLRFHLDDEERVVPLTGPELRLGRSGDNEIVLPDYSVSRRHAAIRADGEEWYVYDLKSTNGVQVNHADVDRAQLRAGDLLKIGVFEMRVEGQGEVATQRLDPALAVAPGAVTDVRPPPLPRDESVISNATIVRSLKEFTADYGLDEGRDSTDVREDKRRALDEAYGTRIFGYLTRLAQTLIKTDSIDVVMERVMDIAFDALPVDRGFMLLRDEKSGELICELVRVNDRVERRPRGEVPISKTMLESVMNERVALLTFDALADQRLAGTESVRIHQIRAAMCAPLWSGEKIIGVMQVDTPHHAGSFTEPDVDLLTTLANFCAVAIERIQNARKVDFERQLRSRLERYHSPGVIEEVMQEEPGVRRLKKAEASVLFADIVGFTAYSEEAPPEEVAELMESYFTHAVEAIFSAGGTLDKFIGDCVMAFFGAPMAQSDHAERAVSAALRIEEAVDDWNAERKAHGLAPISHRIAINSGPVVVGDIGSNRRVDYTVLGNTVNVAARLEESVARPGDIVIGENTYKLLKDKYPTESLGEAQLKGLSRRIHAYRVLGAGA